MMNIDELLRGVQKPARYIGGEWNAVRKEWTDDKVKFLVAFPDAYEVGMSHLGIKILYGILNHRDDCLCERVFAPWKDFEEALRREKRELFSLESRRPIRDFDIIGFSLTYELGYPNVLNMLDLGSIPMKAAERTEDDPLIIAGGPACYNPEPMAEFIDAFVIGEGEEIIEDIVDAFKVSKYHGVKVSRKELLKKIARIDGIYVPSLYEVKYNSDNTIKSFTPLETVARPKIKKRIIKDFENSFYPTDQIVPYIQTVHDRITIEIMRGCKHACRFCQACTIYRPCRERSRARILELAHQTYGMTGYDEISLLSLSSADHSDILGIMRTLNDSFREKAVSISMPSLRVEEMLKYLPYLISQVKKSTLTFAPETASEDLRKVINKDIDMKRLFEAVAESFKAGWHGVKLYFMIGLPTEEAKDLVAIAGLVKEISDLKKQLDGHPAHVVVSVNAFVPKPHTPFQWKAMEPIESLVGKREILRRNIRSANIKLDLHPFETSFIEAALTRGDRRLSGVIYNVWLSGGRFEGWEDLFHYGRWMEAFSTASLDPAFYVTRERSREEMLPWDFIDIGVSKDWLLKESLHT